MLLIFFNIFFPKKIQNQSQKLMFIMALVPLIQFLLLFDV